MRHSAKEEPSSNLSRKALVKARWMVGVVIFFVAALPDLCYGQKGVEVVQEYYTHTRSTAAHLSGPSLKVDTSCGFRLSANPTPEYCSERCTSRAFLKISLGCSGTLRRYVSPDTTWSVSAQVALAVRNDNNDLIADLSGTIQIDLNSTTQQIIPVSVWQRSVTEYSAGSCESEEYFRFDSIQVTIVSLDSSGITGIDDSLWLDVEIIEVETVSGLKEGTTLADCSSSGNIMIEPLQVTGVNPITLEWETVDCPNDSFPNYQVQILKLYNYDTTYQHTDSTISTAVNWGNALTVETYGPQMDLTLTLAEGTGFYVWRVRPIGDQYPNSVGHELNWGCWSTAPPDGTTNLLVTTGVGGVEISGHDEWEPSVFYYEQFDDSLNWNYVRTWVEGLDGKPGVGEMINFANGLERPRQMQVFDHQTDNVLASVTAYDYEGRGQLHSMTAPVSSGYLGYRADVFDGGSGYPYRAADFDVYAQTVGTANGAIAAYWSASNADGSIPSAEGYPFSRSVLTADPLSEAREESGPGSVLKIGGGNTTRHYLTSPADNEIVSIFGDEAPSVSMVMKNVTIDPNGVRSVAYVDNLGRTIATCLERLPSPPVAHVELDDNDTLNPLSTVTVLTKGVKSGANSVSASKTFLLADPTVVRLDYSLKKQTVDVACAQLCLTCDYEILLKLYNDSTQAVVWQDSLRYVPTSSTPEIDSLTDAISANFRKS